MGLTLTDGHLWLSFWDSEFLQTNPGEGLRWFILTNKPESYRAGCHPHPLPHVRGQRPSWTCVHPAAHRLSHPLYLQTQALLGPFWQTPAPRRTRPSAAPRMCPTRHHWSAVLSCHCSWKPLSSLLVPQEQGPSDGPECPGSGPLMCSVTSVSEALNRPGERGASWAPLFRWGRRGLMPAFLLIAVRRVVLVRGNVRLGKTQELVTEVRR